MASDLNFSKSGISNGNQSSQIMVSLQSVEEALEKEIQKLEEIGKEPCSSSDSFSNSTLCETTVSEENLYRQKIHLGVENLIVSKSTQESTQLSVVEAQKCLANEQIQMLHRLKDAEHKADILKTQAEELEASCGKLLATEEVLKMQNRLYEYALCFIAQIILLLFVFVIFMLRPKTSGIVPT
ncbi:hypothetical protein ACHQM5_029576 [Ranunculus cassubicifolius]